MNATNPTEDQFTFDSNCNLVRIVCKSVSKRASDTDKRACTPRSKTNLIVFRHTHKKARAPKNYLALLFRGHHSAISKCAEDLPKDIVRKIYEIMNIYWGWHFRIDIDDLSRTISKREARRSKTYLDKKYTHGSWWTLNGEKVLIYICIKK